MSVAEPAGDPPPWRVLVSGFLDWPVSREAAAGFDPWRCMENPSGRLFIGRWHEGGEPPDATGGELPRLLRELHATGDGRPIHWTFETLPVQWDVARELDTSNYNAVVNIGLGVYDADERLLVERGAFNRRSAKCDASGRVPGEDESIGTVIDPRAGDVIEATPAIDERLDGLSGAVPGTGYRVSVAPARAENAFVCNETHAAMLRRLHRGGRLCRVGFIHIPRPPTDDGYDELACALAHVVERLVQP